MKFSFEVGINEKIRIEYSRNWFTGRTWILLNGRMIVAESPLSSSTHFNTLLKRGYELEVGISESHKVVIEKERPLLFAGFRPHTYRVTVDGKLILEKTGY